MGGDGQMRVGEREMSHCARFAITTTTITTTDTYTTNITNTTNTMNTNIKILLMY